MRISDWSSDVCSSDLMSAVFQVVMHHGANCQWYLFRQIQLGRGHGFQHACTKICDDIVVQRAKYRLAAVKHLVEVESGRASCRGRVCQDVEISRVAGSIKKNKKVNRHQSKINR